MKLFRGRPDPAATGADGAGRDEPSPHELVVEFEAALRERRQRAAEADDRVEAAEREAEAHVEERRAAGRRAGEERAAEVLGAAHARADEIRQAAERDVTAFAERVSERHDEDVAWVLSRVLPGEGDA